MRFTLQLFQRGAAVPLHCVAHRWIECFEFGVGAPADRVVFLGGERGGPPLHSREVDHSDVFVRVADAVDVEESRADQRARPWTGRRGTLADQIDGEAAFLERLA